jgi:hypothetical protein
MSTGPKEFYGRLRWRLDADGATDEFRLVRFTPSGFAGLVPIWRTGGD